MLLPAQIIQKKRDGNALTEEEIRFFINGFTSGELPDYQMSALAMAICFQGMKPEETMWLTRAMVESGAPEPLTATFAGMTTFGHGRSAIAAHLESGGQPDIVVCSSDWSAHGVLDELQRRHIRVPDDMAVIGFGDLDFAADLNPSLTTVKIDGGVIGRQAAQFLMQRARGDKIKNPIVDIGFSLIVRNSG